MALIVWLVVLVIMLPLALYLGVTWYINRKEED